MNANAPYIKMVSEQFDRCHGTLLQFVDFLSGAVAPSIYAQMIPSLSDLGHKYHLDPEVMQIQMLCFLIIRVSQKTTILCVLGSSYLSLGFSLQFFILKVQMDLIQVAFLIYRPVMRLFRSVKNLEICWPLSVSADFENHTSDSDVLLDVSSSRASIRYSII